MKILVVVSEFPKLTETFVYRNIAEYKRLGHEVTLFHAKPRLKGELIHDFARDQAETAFTYGFVSGESLGALARETLAHPATQIGLAAELVGAHLQEPVRGAEALAVAPQAMALGRWCKARGIDHIHGEFAGFPATIAMIASRVSGVPFSITAHANDIFVSQALLVEKAREARFVRTISRYNIDFLSALPGFPVEKLRLIRTGVDRALLEAPPPEAPGEGPLNLLYVGSLAGKKGVSHLIDALAALSGALDFRCRIIGRGELRGALEAQVAALGLGDRVAFDGPQDAEGVRAAYGWSHAVVVPSVPGTEGRIEGIPVVAMEALAHARPLIASRLSGIPELVEEGVTGWLTEPGDAAGIAAALRAIRDDWPAAAAVALRGRDRIRAEYMVDDNAAALLAAMETA